MAAVRKVKEKPGRAGHAIEQEDEREERERGLDQTLEDTYPASDPLSTIPDPEEEPVAA